MRNKTGFFCFNLKNVISVISIKLHNISNKLPLDGANPGVSFLF